MGEMDEEAERRAFQEAVMSWRQGSSHVEPGGKSLLVNVNTDTDDAGGGGVGAGQWSNPFGGDGGGRKSSVTAAAGMEEHEKEQDMVIVSARSHYSPQQRDHQGLRPDSGGGGGGGKSLADGVLDEEKERKEFQAAVSAWRSGENHEPSKNKAVAARLAQQMDAQHEQSSQKLREDQDHMLRKIEEVR